ncbi:MAG: hypothetical protein DRO88_06085 [Promethearchaeia archaeon]|nr:MAG: hypothetical protein DRO88_06085 [Candidatus Lokiarchaeia archaeon]
MRFAKEGYFWVIPAILLDIGWHIISLPTKYNPWLYFWVITFPTTVGIILLASFFRDPDRRVPSDYDPQHDILSPADGTLVYIQENPEFISLFVEMHYHNVHVVRAPCNLTVKKIIRQKGKHHLVYFIKATSSSTTKALQKNARTILTLETEYGDRIMYYMICGAFFRRSKPYVKEGDKVKAGERMGMIVFGSTLKMEIPNHHQKIQVKIGSKVKAGVTILYRH